MINVLYQVHTDVFHYFVSTNHAQLFLQKAVVHTFVYKSAVYHLHSYLNIQQQLH